MRGVTSRAVNQALNTLGAQGPLRTTSAGAKNVQQVLPSISQSQIFTSSADWAKSMLVRNVKQEQPSSPIQERTTTLSNTQKRRNSMDIQNILGEQTSSSTKPKHSQLNKSLLEQVSGMMQDLSIGDVPSDKTISSHKNNMGGKGLHFKKVNVMKNKTIQDRIVQELIKEQVQQQVIENQEEEVETNKESKQAIPLRIEGNANPFVTKKTQKKKVDLGIQKQGTQKIVKAFKQSTVVQARPWCEADDQLKAKLYSTSNITSIVKQPQFTMTASEPIFSFGPLKTIPNIPTKVNQEVKVPTYPKFIMPEDPWQTNNTKNTNTNTSEAKKENNNGIKQPKNPWGVKTMPNVVISQIPVTTTSGVNQKSA